MTDVETTPKRVKRGWMNLRIADIKHETPDTNTFVFVDAEEGGRPYDFIAGQYLTFRYDDLADKPIVRSYTMSGSPCQNDGTYVTVKRIPGGLVSNWMCDKLKVGDILRARGPIGKFVYDYKTDTRDIYMVAAGSGVTPFTSILREYSDRLGRSDTPQSLHLLVAFRTTEDLINWDVLSKVKDLPNVRVIVTLTRQHAEGFWYGRPDNDMLAKFFGTNYRNGTFLTCGPQALMDLTSDYLSRAGIAPERIKTESFE